ncbi:MAG: hypothetical protein A2566_00945 [Candidatus Zambryskibacteria bacterium RIFOXYD1_FULL_40_13]|nr:MAG: NUDIX hydrolase [Parcubacteria group bacterium GW2011_GWD1_40_9]OHA86839.1 MAG: hypothetical protein A2123_00900 [Candidatus Zambryskibacteria bacterium GWB1_40_5]OHB16111.1 MAG: hypothetical protein A2566_00945 [Candidatus Zambryskibacteria bacterium RIFOXYD1_FULL_40_13]HBD24898.1 hypothetical protein [Candidatus Zambryskibacteria bacterium]HBO17771.1 hypothetical protein [Candidatus Zambryskibacteria bacterium]
MASSLTPSGPFDKIKGSLFFYFMSEKIQKAGAIILSSENKNNIALLYRGREKDWSFPKGHVDLGENSTQTMVREMKEETGLTVNVIKPLPDMEYIHSNGNCISTKMFLVSSNDDTQLRLELEGDVIMWVSKDEVIEKLSYDNLKNYFRNVSSIVNSVVTS